MSAGVVLLSADFRLLAVNQSFCRLFGTAQDSVRGRRLEEVLSGQLAERVAALVSREDGRPTDVIAKLEDEGAGRIYRARLTQIQRGPGNEGVFVLLVEDIENRTGALSNPEEFRRLYEKVLENVSEAVFFVGQHGAVTDANQSAAKLLGYSRQELFGMRFADLQYIPDGGIEATLSSYLESRNWKLDGRQLAVQVARKDGAVFPAELKFNKFSSGGHHAYLVNLRDVTREKLANQLSHDRLQVIEMIAHHKPLEDILDEVTALIEHQMPGGCCAVMLKRGEGFIPAAAPRLPSALIDSIYSLPVDQEAGSCATAVLEGRTIAVSDIASEPGWGGSREEALAHGLHSSLFAPVFSSHGLVVGMIAVFRPETGVPDPAQVELVNLASRLASVCIEQRELTSELAHRAQHDSLTGLPNRLNFEGHMRQAIAHAGRYKRRVAILSIDLDRFKVVNDTLGHAAGDEVIKQVGRRLANCLRETDIVARWGGDEFMVGLLEIAEHQDAAAVAQKLIQSIAQPFEFAGREVSTGASIGASVFPDNGMDLDTLISHADMAMYRAKKSGRNGFNCYTTELGETDRQRLELETRFRSALQRDELTIHYQPQFELRTGSLVGLEALLRWRNEKLGNVPPSSFIPIAEDSGLIVGVGEWTIREACRQIKEFEQSGYGPIRIAVNVSSLQFQRREFVELVAQIIAEAGIAPDLLELELTESMVMQTMDETAPKMAQLRTLGIRMSLDDFGTGYSSLSYLQRLPIDTLKIDKSFVRELEVSPKTPLLIESIVALAQSLGMRAIAEGVESDGQLEVLRTIGCDQAQGYLLGRPVPKEELVPLLGGQIRAPWQATLMMPTPRRGRRAPRKQPEFATLAAAMGGD